MKRFKNPYADEHEMLVAFADAMKAKGWRVFPETGGYDLLLVATDEVEAVGIKPGDQVGVEGKRAGNLKLLVQARPQPRARQGPHYHLAVIPRATPEFQELATALRIIVVEACERRWVRGEKVWEKSSFAYTMCFFAPLYRQYYDEPCWHPEVEIWVPPGVNSPKTLSPWKIKAVKLCLLAKEQGYLTSQDFRAAGLSMTVWRNRWIVDAGTRSGRYKKYVLWEEGYPLDAPPHMKYPEIADALRADIDNYDEQVEKHFEGSRRKRRRRRRGRKQVA